MVMSKFDEKEIPHFRDLATLIGKVAVEEHFDLYMKMYRTFLKTPSPQDAFLSGAIAACFVIAESPNISSFLCDRYKKDRKKEKSK